MELSEPLLPPPPEQEARPLIANRSSVALGGVEPTANLVLSRELITDLTGAETVRPEWSGLLTRAGRHELTQTPEWLLTWWQVYGPSQGRQLRLVLIRAGDRLVGLAPLLVRRHWYGCLPFRRVEFLGSGEREGEAIWSNHLGIIAEKGSEEAVVGCLAEGLVRGALGTWDEIVLPMMSGDTPMPDLLNNAFRAAELWVERAEQARAPFVSLPATWADYLRSLPRGHRRQIVRSLATFEEWAGGSSAVVRVRTVADLVEGKRILVELHHSRWAEEGAGVFRATDYLRFHEAIMPLLLERGALELLWLTVRGQPMAALYGMNWAGKVYAYQTGRRLDVPQGIRPGGVLLILAIRAAIEAGQREFDLLADEAPYKLQLATGARSLVRVRAAWPSLLERCRRAAKRGLTWVRQVRKRWVVPAPAAPPDPPRDSSWRHPAGRV